MGFGCKGSVMDGVNVRGVQRNVQGRGVGGAKGDG